MKKRLFILAALLSGIAAHAQTVANVTATIQDGNFTPYAQGTYQIVLVDASGKPVQASPYVPPPVQLQGSLNSTGALAVSLYINSTIPTPIGTQWKFNICSAAPTLTLPLNVVAQSCYTVTTAITGSGDISGTLTASIPTLYYFNPVTGKIECNGGDCGGGGGGGISSIAWSVPTSLFTASPTTLSSSGTQTFALTSANANLVWGNCTGTSATPSYCSITPAMLPVATTGAFGTVKPDGSTITISGGVISAVGGGGGGSVTTFSAGNLSPLFSTSVATPTTTPALSFTLSNAAGGTIYGNATGSSAAPGFTIAPVLGIPGSSIGSVTLASSTATGSVKLQPASAASAFTLTLPAATDTIADLAGTQTLTNKTISGASNTISAIPLASLASQSADTIVGNYTGGSASPTAGAAPSGGTNGCAGTSDTTTYNSTTHAWGCHQISGSGTVSGQASGVIPLGTSASVIGNQSHIDDGNTTAGTITSTEPINISDTTDPNFVGFIANGVAPAVQASAAGWGLGATLTTAGYYKMPDAPGSGFWTATNASGIVTDTFTAAPAGAVVGTTDTQTLTNKSIAASEVNSGTLACAQMPALTGDTTSSAGACATATAKINGGTFPTSALLLAANGSAQPTAATGHGVSNSLNCADSSGSGTAQVCTTSPSFTPVSGDSVIYTTTTANTGTGLTINVNSLGAKSASKWAGSTTTLAANDVLANKQVLATYDGTTWELSTIGNAPSGGGGGALSALTAAVASNTIANGNNPQVWNFAQTTNSQAAFTFGDTSAATGTGDILLDLLPAANSTEIPLNIAPGAATGTTTPVAINIAQTLNNGSLAPTMIKGAYTETADASANFFQFLGGGGGTNVIATLTSAGFLQLSSSLTSTIAAGAMQVCGGNGNCTVNSTSAGGTITLKGASNSGTGAATAGGSFTGQGGDATGATGTVIGGAATLRGGNVASTNVGATPGLLTLSGGGFTAAATNAVGADAKLQSGLGTGNGTPSHVKLLMPNFGASGTTAQTEVTRYTVHAKAGSTTTATATNMFNVALANNQTGAFEVIVHVEAADATPHNCSTTEQFVAVLQDTGGTVTQQTTPGTLATICDLGTLTVTAAFSAASPGVFSVTPAWTVITPTGVIITVEIHNLSQQEITLL